MSSAKKKKSKTQSALVKPPDQSWLDHLTMLLHVGSELEHALMVEYLFAAYSLGGDQVPAEHRPMVKRWQDTILTVAREEMGHLISVQNLLCLIGGPISFKRDEYPIDTPYYPFPFKLERLSLDSLSRYIYAEMPLTMPEDASKREKRIRKAVKVRVEKEVEHPHPVEEIYNAIHDLIQDPGRIPPSAFRPESYRIQASWDEWGKGYRPDAGQDNPVLAAERKRGTAQDILSLDELRARVLVARMGTRTEALTAIQQVAAQGEAPHLQRPLGKDERREPSHFDRFADVYEEFERVEGWSPTREVAENPTTFDPKQYPDRGTYIASETSRTWACLFNLRYRMLLTYLTHTFRLADASGPDGKGLRGPTLHRIFGEMYNLKTIAVILMRSPLTNDRDDPRRAGPPFEMPYSLALPTPEADCWRLHQDLLTTSRGLCKELLKTATGDAQRYLTTLRDLDCQATTWIDQVLTGLGSSRRTVSL